MLIKNRPSIKMISILERLISEQSEKEGDVYELYNEFCENYKIHTNINVFWIMINYFISEFKKANKVNLNKNDLYEHIKYFPEWIRTNIQYFDGNTKKITSLDEEIPWLNFYAIEFLEKLIEKNYKIFEFGVGGSTIYFGKKASEIISCEHDPNWFEEVKKVINKYKNINWKGYLIAPTKMQSQKFIDPSDPNGYTSSDENFRGYSFKEYVSFIDKFDDEYFDLILIDGRARPSCVKHAFNKLKDGGIIILDNSEREHYKYIHYKLQNNKCWNFFGPGPYGPNFWQTSIWQKAKVMNEKKKKKIEPQGILLGEGCGKRNKLSIEIKDLNSALQKARSYFSTNYLESFDIYEQIVDSLDPWTQSNIIVNILAEVYEQYKRLPYEDRYRLYQARYFDFGIKSGDKVLDIGSGSLPFPLATHLADITLSDNKYGRAGEPFKYLEGKPVFECNVENMPFKDKEFDFIYCSHVLEHVSDPEKACKELMRVGKRGFIETPTRGKDLFLNNTKISNHRWAVECYNDTLIFTEYRPEDIKGLNCNILNLMHIAPQTVREKAFSALIYLKADLINTMFYWENEFKYEVRRLKKKSKYFLPRLEEEENEEAKDAVKKQLSIQPDREGAKGLLEKIELDKKKIYSMKSDKEAFLDSQIKIVKYNKNNNKILKFMQVDTFYPRALQILYNNNPMLSSQSFEEQIYKIFKFGFSAVHTIGPYMKELGYEVQWVIANCYPAQFKWAQENNVKFDENNWIYQIVSSQIEKFKPDILYTTDCMTFDSHFFRKLSYKPSLIIGWQASDIPYGTDWSEFDIIFSPISTLRKEAINRGAKNSIEFLPGFPEWVFESLKDIRPIYDIVFCGQWTTNQHENRNRLLDILAKECVRKNNNCAFFLSGQIDKLTPDVLYFQKGERYGIDMFKEIRRGRIGFDARGYIRSFIGTNNIVDAGENETANMRIFETTGCGSFLLTEHFENLSKYFEIGKEIETFSNEHEMIDKVRYYLSHNAEREEIAYRGNMRCLQDHSMKIRILELDEIIKKFTSNRIERSNNEIYYNIDKKEYKEGYTTIDSQNDLKNVLKFALKQRFGKYIVHFMNLTIFCHDLLSFYIFAKDIFIHRIYDFESQKLNPKVIDAGGYIGLFTLYVKTKYPDAEVTIFEPDEESYLLLSKNLEINNFKDVKLIKSGIYKYDGEISFGSDHSNGSSIFSKNKNSTIKVERLSKYINSEIDFLKINIEGAEFDVIKEIESKLHLVKEIVIEYHGFPEIQQCLHKILEILDRNGFRYLIHDFDVETNSATKPPFKLYKNTRFFLLIYAKRIYNNSESKKVEDINFQKISLQPISRVFGYDRGTPIDRYYIEKFLEENKAAIHGCVLEIGDNTYTQKYGTNVSKSEILNAVQSPNATIVGDLATGKNIPEATFDCIILTQTLLCIYEVKSALKHTFKALKSGGTLLITVPGISQISRYDMDRWGDFWRFTDKSMRMLIEEVCPDCEVVIKTYGNVFVAKAFLDGIAWEELPPEVLEYNDNDYQLVITAKVVKKNKLVPSISKTKVFLETPIILLYHRVAEDPIDSQLLCVSPNNFEKHLKIISENFRVIPLYELIQELKKGLVIPNTISITFDDGYSDNYVNVLPLLEEYKLHSTIFITAGLIGSKYEFWWDALEKIFLTVKALPDKLCVLSPKGKHIWNLRTAEGRLVAYDEICEILRYDAFEDIQKSLNDLFEWSKVDKNARSTHRIINEEELRSLSKSQYIEIGSHSLTHTKLNVLPYEKQRKEIFESKRIIEEIICKTVRLFSYPFGSSIDFSEETKRLLIEAGYIAGIANIQSSIIKPIDLYALPRRLVRNFSGNLFFDWLLKEEKDGLEKLAIQERRKRIISFLSK